MIAELVSICRREEIKLNVVPPARGIFGTAVQLNHVADLPVIEYNTWDVSRSTLFLKRVLDVAFSGAALVLLSPLFAAIMLAIAIDSRGPIIFSQLRSGMNRKTFRMYKFRTMVSDAERRLSEVVSLDELRDPMFKLRRDPRVTRVGRALRRASLDELPQLVNVLKGDMSLVGPRPEQIELTERYLPEHEFRLAVKPGITGPDAGVRPRRADLRRAPRCGARVRREPLARPGSSHPRTDPHRGRQRQGRVLAASRPSCLACKAVSVRVALVTIDDFAGPTSKQAHLLAAELARRGHECLLLVRGDPRSFSRLGRVQHPRLGINAYRFVGPSLSRHTRRVVTDFRPDLVHCYELRVASFVASNKLARMARAPLVVHVADEDRLLFREAGATPLRRAARPILRRAARLYPPAWPFWDPRLDPKLRRSAAAFDALTPELAALVERRVGRPCHVVLPPVRIEEIRAEVPPAPLRQLGLEGRQFVLYTGALFRPHLPDFSILLDAFKLIGQRFPQAELVHVGHVSSRIKLRNLVPPGLGGRVRYLGYLPSQQDVFGLMRAATALVQPGAPSDFNRYRFPSKLMDYLLSGRPVVTFEVGAGRLLKDGEHALLTRTASPFELAEKLELVLGDPDLGRRLGSGGRRRARELFDADANGDRLLELYEIALGAAPRGQHSG